MEVETTQLINKIRFSWVFGCPRDRFELTIYISLERLGRVWWAEAASCAEFWRGESSLDK
jgi:hypothetical protein